MAHPSQPPRDAKAAAPHGHASVHAEVCANILAQRVGEVPLADLTIPTPLLSRIADRVVRVSFAQRHRIVTDGKGSPSTEHINAPLTSPGAPALASLHAQSTPTNPQHPGLSSEALAALQRSIRVLLSRDGLLPATAHALTALGVADFLQPTPHHLELFNSVGIPTDLLAHFSLDHSAPRAQEVGTQANTPALATLGAIAHLLHADPRPERAARALRKARFTFTPTIPHFQAAPDSGAPHTTLAAHLPRPVYYAGPGDGGNLDLLRHVLAATPTLAAHVITPHDQQQAARAALADIPRSAPLTLHALPSKAPSFALTQWACDHSRAGHLHPTPDSQTQRSPAHLHPRFASRREELSEFLPTDDAAAHLLPGSHARSPLLFQSGNLLLVEDHQARTRFLLVGESELSRNQLLGLSSEQTKAALCAEFSAHSCVALPAASYHIDQEVSVLSLPNHAPIAFVPDVPRAVQLVIEAALIALRPLMGDAADFAHASLANSHHREALTLLWNFLAAHRTPDGSFPLSLAHPFAREAPDNAVGNFQTFLCALDHLAALCAAPSEFQEPHFRAVIESHQRRAADRAAIRQTLARLGWVLAPIPAMPDDERGFSPLNMVHLGAYTTAHPPTCLVPTMGDFYRNFDAAVFAAVQAACQHAPPTLIPIPSAESQRREGAVRCSLNCW